MNSSRPVRGIGKSSLTLFGATALALLLLAMLTFGTARADEEQTTQGEAGSGSGGTATIDNIADLTYYGNCQAPNSLDYDDDPIGDPNDDRYYVTPTLGDEPIKEACKYIFVRNPNDVNELQLTIRHDSDSGPIVFSQLIPAAAAVPTAGTCADYLGATGTSGTVANGLVETDQKTADYLVNFRNYCIQDTGALYVVVFPISKHLPPGDYWQCVAISHSGGSSSPRYCEQQIVINPITGFASDINGVVDFGNLTQNVKSIAEGDFLMDGANPDGGGTVMGLGNTSPQLDVRYSWMQNTTFDTGEDKYIQWWFDAQLNRRDEGGAIINFHHIDNLLGGADPDSADPFAGADTATFDICLEPNEPLKLDFSVTPQQALYEGVYTGLVFIGISSAPGCEPQLDTGESAAGDTNVFDNYPQGPFLP